MMHFEHFDKFRKMGQPFSKLSALTRIIDPLPQSLRQLLNATGKHRDLAKLLNIAKHPPAFGLHDKSVILSQLNGAINVVDLLRRVNDSPEVQFITISDIGLLSISSTNEVTESLESDEIDEQIAFKEEIVERNLLPYLEELGIDHLWRGATHALNDADNPDGLRHTLVSLRTLLEYLIEGQLAPNELLAKDERFAREFKRFHAGYVLLEAVKVPRRKRIEYFASQVEFGVLEELTKRDIDLICEFYSVLCDVHNPKILFSQNQVRILKVKTGITLWLLSYINEAMNNTN